MDEVIGELLGRMMTPMVSRVLKGSFQDLLETHLIMGNIVSSAHARSIRSRHLDDFIGKRLASIVDLGDPIHAMTNNIFENRVSIATIA